MENIDKVLTPELHGLLCAFVNEYIVNAGLVNDRVAGEPSEAQSKSKNFEIFGKSFFENAQRKRQMNSRQIDSSTKKAVDSLSSDTAALYKLVECDPDILHLRDRLRFLVLGYLLNNPKDIEKYGTEYFRNTRVIENPASIRRVSVCDSTDFNAPIDTIVRYEKSPEEYEQLRNKIRHALLFRSLDDSQMDQVLNSMFKLKVDEGSFVIRQGDDGDYFYVVDDGTFEAYVKDGRGIDQKVSTYKGKGSFGELALLYNMPRVATVKAISDGSLWCLDRDSFRKIVVRSAVEKRELYGKLISNVPALSALNTYEKQTLADALQPLTYQDGECIIKQSDDNIAGMYLVEKGTVVFSYTNREGRVSKLQKISEGGYFGELALVNKRPRAVSAYASGRVRLAFIDRESFERLLGPCQEIMERHAASYQQLS